MYSVNALGRFEVCGIAFAGLGSEGNEKKTKHIASTSDPRTPNKHFNLSRSGYRNGKSHADRSPGSWD